MEDLSIEELMTALQTSRRSLWCVLDHSVSQLSSIEHNNVLTTLFDSGYHTSDACILQARLNERNIVELINKLQKLGLLDEGLLHTIDGREYVTAEHLREEIVDAIKSSGGRVALVRTKSLHDSGSWDEKCGVNATTEKWHAGGSSGCIGRRSDPL